MYMVSIHAPAKGATFAGGVLDGGGVFQSTLPRRERRDEAIHIVPSLLVSIHAPAKGATVIERVPVLNKAVSIHAPAKGATAISAKNSF